LPKISIF